MISVYTDACRKKIGDGGYGYLIKNTNFTTFAGSYLEGITNNYAELEAVIQLCYRLGKDFNHDNYYMIHCDSAYFVNGFNEWMERWSRQGWTKIGGPKNAKVANLAQWLRLFEYKNSLHLKAKWVRGHAGDECNEFCDRVANFCHTNKCSISGIIPTGASLVGLDLNAYVDGGIININDVMGSYGSVN